MSSPPSCRPLRERLGIDFVIANGENAAGGFGLTRNVANDLFATGVDVLTTGNHWLDQKEILGFIDDEDRVLRPLNYPKGTPGRGAGLYHTRDGARVLVINPMGRIFMDPLDDPFAAVDAELAACPLARRGGRHHRRHARRGDVGEDGDGPFLRRPRERRHRHAQPRARRQTRKSCRSAPAYQTDAGRLRRLRFRHRHGQVRAASALHQEDAGRAA